ncbi:hypothetical protein KFE25_012248 [Diacronema lutheri]|uniref:B-related factor 1 n=1 Tax=Diacronema lutheri TaxID=2081491 RepID=A0A8J6CCF0_DIALT|nr:hypothetical protein KFE25_012248 [Diacronema lutheri]
MSSARCPACGSDATDFDAVKGDTVCLGCGTVIEESAIISEVQFADDATGGARVVGQFVAPGDVGSGCSSLFVKQRGEITMLHGRRMIARFASSLRLNAHCVDAAQRYYHLAHQFKFNQGRRSAHVAAVCLYIVCRRERAPVMLLDLSDLLQTNVFALGVICVKLVRVLHLQLPLVDPSLYIHRFAARLELGGKTHVVGELALRLVARMKRDWMETGRRPSGVCAAALLIASRAHGYARTLRCVSRVLKVGDTTLRTRLAEFAQTPCGALTALQVKDLDVQQLLEAEEADPPSLARNRNAEGARPSYGTPLVHALAVPCAGKIDGMPCALARPLAATALVVVQAVKMRTPPDAADHRWTAQPLAVAQRDGGVLDVASAACRMRPHARVAAERALGGGGVGVARLNAAPGRSGAAFCTVDAELVAQLESCAQLPLGWASSRTPAALASAALGRDCDADPRAPTGVLSPGSTRARADGDEDVCLRVEEDANVEKEGSDGRLSDLSDGELETYIISTGDELTLRSQLWTELNQDWLEHRRRKDAEAMASISSKRTYKRRARADGTAATASGAVQAALARKGVSASINYDVLTELAMRKDMADVAAMARAADTMFIPSGGAHGA